MKEPLRDKDYEYDDYYETEEPGLSKQMISAMYEEMLYREKDNGIAPDTAGVDYFFIEGFINDAMSWEFEAIEEEFLKHCHDKLDEFADVSICGNIDGRMNSPMKATEKKFLSLIYSGAKLNDEYCIELLKHLYRVFYKKEYNQLKRFREISVNELFGLSEDPLEYDRVSYTHLGRIMGMCSIMGIKLQDEATILYRFLDKVRKEWQSADEEECDSIIIEDELFKECLNELEHMISNVDEKEVRKSIRRTQRYEQFLEACFNAEGYPGNFSDMILDYEHERLLRLAKTYALLKTIYPKREYTFDEIVQYSYSYSLIAAAVEMNNFYDAQISMLLRKEEPYNADSIDGDKPLFNPEKIVIKNSNEKETKKVITNVAPVNLGEAKEEDYIAEIAKLRNKLSEKEQKIKNLSDMYRVARKTQRDAEALLDKGKSDREELIALREYAYKSTVEEEAIAETSIDEMKDAIKDKSIVIIGGHINWINKMKKEFPEWMFVSVDNFKTVDRSLLDGKEMVYFYTDYISHTAYGKFIAALRENKIRFGYLGSLNIDSVVKRIYDDVI